MKLFFFFHENFTETLAEFGALPPKYKPAVDETENLQKCIDKNKNHPS